MNNSLAPKPPVLAKRTSAMTSLSLNALLLPGLGTVMRGMSVGYAQMALSAVGLLISGFASAGLMRGLLGIKTIPEDAEAAWSIIRTLRPELIAFGGGLLLFTIGWIWGIASCVRFFREDRLAAVA